MNELRALLDDLANTRVWIEIGAIAACMAVAWAASWLIGRKQPKDSIWFGSHTIDGVFFPLLALGLVFGARVIVSHYQPVAVLRLAVPVFMSLAAIRLFALVLEAVFPKAPAVKAFARVFSWLAWLAAILWILGLLGPILTELDAINLTVGKSRVSVRTLIEGTLSCLLVLIVALWISATIEKRLLLTHINDLSVRKVAGNVIRTLLLLVGFLFALSAVGVDLTALSVLGGAVGVGLGFGLQKLAANYVSGFVILIERSLRIGDNVKVDGFEGVVTDIKTRYTLMRGNNGRESIVPNELFITQRVENTTIGAANTQIINSISVGYESDVDQVRDILLGVVAQHPRVLKDPKPSVFLTDFGADGLEFQLWFWISDPANGTLGVRSDLNFAMLKALKAADIDIPYPQRVLHVQNPTGLPVADAAAKPPTEAV